MARVNHKKVKQLLNEKRSKITDRQFFSSRILAGHYEDMAAAITRRYHYNRRVRVSLYWDPKDGTSAATDNMFVRINCGNPFVTKIRGRENRYEIVTGLFAHELGHVLHTDFLAGQTYVNALANGRWYPAPPNIRSSVDARNEQDLWDYAAEDPKNLKMIQYIAHFISNVIEDGYIENRMLVNFPGSLKYGLESLRDRHYEEMPTVTQLIEKEESGSTHIFDSILQIMLSYAKFGSIKYGDEPLSDERIQTVFGLLTEIDSALCNCSGKDRFTVTSTILVRCWSYIKDYLELCKERQAEAEAAGGTPEVATTLSEMLQSIAGSSTAGTGNSAPVADGSDDSESSATASERERTRKDAEGTDAEEDNAEDDAAGAGDDAETDGSNAEPDSGDPAAGVTDLSEDSEDGPPPQSGENSSNASQSGELPDSFSGVSEGKQEVSSSEGGRIPLKQTDHLSEPVGGSVERDEEYEREKYDRAAADIERVLDQMALKAACAQLENERIQELNDAAKSISYGNIHAGVNIRVQRITGVDDDLVEQYNAIAAPLLTISRQLQRSLIQQLKDNRRGGKQTGLLMGRRLDAHALHRNDGKVFYKNALPNEIPELAVGLLLDESGSMCSCDRATYARASAIILYDFCRALDIPVMVYGHSTGYSREGSTVDLYSYAEFDSIDNDDQYRMMDISARGSNRDGAALRFVAEQLSKRPEDVKILILVSDGQPADSGYGGTAAEEDLRGIKQEYQRKGILFVAAAIGDDKANIQRIYGDSFLDITDLNQLPTKLTAVVKRHIRV